MVGPSNGFLTMALRAITRIVLFAILAAGLAACGRGGPPEAPTASVTAGQPADAAAGEKTEDKRFVLDPLI